MCMDDTLNILTNEAVRLQPYIYHLHKYLVCMSTNRCSLSRVASAYPLTILCEVTACYSSDLPPNTA